MQPIRRIAATCVTAGVIAASAYASFAEVNVWPEIRDSAREITASLPRQWDIAKHSQRVNARAAELAQGRDRATIEALYRGLPIADDELSFVSGLLAARLAVEIADPDEVHELRAFRTDDHPLLPLELPDVLMTALDCYHDRRAMNFLLDTAEAARTAVIADHLGQMRFLRTVEYPAISAVRLLRGYDDPEVRTRLAALLAVVEVAERHGGPVHPQFQPAGLPAELRGALASIDYAAALPDDGSRARFREFETRLWRARIIGPKGFRGMNTAFDEVARQISRRRRVEYEPFVLRIFETDSSVSDERRVAIPLVLDLSPAGQERIAAIAAGSTTTAAAAAQAVQRIERDKQRTQAQRDAKAALQKLQD